jgi:hypothetical protein
VHPMLNGVSRGKIEKKNLGYLFSQPTVFLILQLVLQIHLYTHVFCVCVVCYAEGRDIPTLWTLSRMRFSTEKTPFIERYFFAIKNSFSLMTSGTKIISFFYVIREASTVLRKSKLFPLVRAVLSRNLLPRCCCGRALPLRHVTVVVAR